MRVTRGAIARLMSSSRSDLAGFRLTTVSYAADASTPDAGSTQKHNAAVGMSDVLCRLDRRRKESRSEPRGCLLAVPWDRGMNSKAPRRQVPDSAPAAMYPV